MLPARAAEREKISLSLKYDITSSSGIKESSELEAGLQFRRLPYS